MPVHEVTDVRNIAFVGHPGSGKTTVGEAILLATGVTGRLGNVDDGSSSLDFDDESKERQHTVDTHVFYIEHEGKLLNLIDTPGTPDHCGPALSSFAAVDIVVAVVNAGGGLGVGTRRMLKAAEEHGLARMILSNRIASANDSCEELYRGIQDTFGHAIHAINLPADGGNNVVDVLEAAEGATDFSDPASAHQELVEAIVETDEDLMNAYMETGAAPIDKLGPAIRQATADGNLIPVMFCDAQTGSGINELLHAIITFGPSPERGLHRHLIKGSGEKSEDITIAHDPKGPFIAQVFKVTHDPKSHIRYAVARVHEGTLKNDDQILVGDDRKGHRVGHMFRLRGADHIEVDSVTVGDIVAFPKLEAKIGDMLWDKASEGTIPLPKLPTPMFALAITPKGRGDAEKISTAMHRYTDEDPCFLYERDDETGETLMRGMGDLHLTVIQSRMKRDYKLEVDTHAPKIPYRETISGSAKGVEYTHKKQSGGAGQFARVFIDLEPNERGAGYEFIDKIFGGAIDQQFRPAVDKGIRGQMVKGVIAGCQVVDVKVSLVDGKTHPVDSKDVAFQTAGRQAFKKAFMAAKPMLLEPIVTMEVTAPQDSVGDIQKDLPSKRGQITGQDILPGGQVIVHAQVPLAEVTTYASQLKSMTAGQGSFTMDFSHYDIMPSNVQQDIMKAYASQAEDDEE